MTEFKRGMQIAYVPKHAYDDLRHPDVQFGFVTSVREKACFCRYWSKNSPGELRTKANSELTPKDLLVPCFSKNELEIRDLMERMGI
jgi:hypothetical protein